MSRASIIPPTQSTLRDKIRVVLARAEKPLTSGQIAARAKLSSREVATVLSAMALKTKEVRREKKPGCYSTYVRIGDRWRSGGPNNRDLKVAQLRTFRDLALRSGLTLIDEIIADYDSGKLELEAA